MIIEENKRYAMFVESPEKAKTINKIFKDSGIKNIFVMATIGHFIKIADGKGFCNTGIYPENDFKADFIIDPAKADNVKKLKEQVKIADNVLVATDPDREGEAIAWSCVKFLNIPKNKYKRVTYHAINKKAILDGIANASELDENLVKAANARRILDKILGFSISSSLRDNKKGKSGGRVQSAALRMIVEREEEILNFKPEKYIDLYLNFSKNGTDFKAKYQGTDSKNIDKLKTQEEVDAIFNDCKGNDFIIGDIENKIKNDNPRVPFCTATFQQEAYNKLGLVTEQAQSCAQKLFDSGKISYHRTDSEQFEPEFENELKAFVKDNFKPEYVSGKVTKGKIDENEQGGHEALHVLDLNLTPEKYAKEAPSELLVKVYRIIYNRTVACALNPAQIAETKYNIYNKKHKFTLTSNELKFDGYRCVYAYKDTDEKSEEDSLVKESFKKNEILQNCSFNPVNKETKPKSRFKESSFVKEMKEVGIGRPSTYDTTVKNIKSPERGYVIVEDNYLKPTERGIGVDHFLRENFPDLINIPYTREMEKDLDLIAKNKLQDLDFLNTTYSKLLECTKNTKKTNTAEVTDKICPECGKPLVKRKGKFGYFLGCSGYPKCKHIEKLESNKNE